MLRQMDAIRTLKHNHAKRVRKRKPVMNLKILETDENEKHQFYAAVCVVTAGRGDNSVNYNVRLIYEQNGERRRLSGQSKLE